MTDDQMAIGAVDPLRFDGARLLLQWAREDAEDFDSVANAFLKGDMYKSFWEVDPETGNQTQKIRLFEPPATLRKLAFHSLLDLKHALDQATYAACSPLLRNVPRTIYFPIGSSPTNLRARLRDGPYPVELWPSFEGFEPYPTGNDFAGGSDAFMAFSKLANASKHVLALGVEPAALVTQAVGMSAGLVSIPAPGHAFDATKGELELATFSEGCKPDVKFEIASFIGFRDVPAFEGEPVASTLGMLANWVESVIAELEASLSDALAERG